MEIYKDVPEQFHNQFMETITMIERKKIGKRTGRRGVRRMLPLAAVLVLALSTLTVSAACVFLWHQAAKETLGVSESLAETMLEEGSAKQEFVSDMEENIHISMIQSVMTDKYCYFLLSLEVSEGIVIDEDTLIGEISVESEAEFEGCVINQVSGSIQGTRSLWEIKLLTLETENYGGREAEIILNDLVQTRKTEVTETIAEAEWRLPVTLPLESGLLTNCEETILLIGHHEVKIDRIRISPFEIRMYGEKEELQHAIQYQNVKISGIEYMDGMLVEEDAYINVTKGRTDERTGEYYIGVDLTTAIDLEKYSGIVLETAEEGNGLEVVSTEEPAEKRKESGDVLSEEMTVLYERCGHQLLYDGEVIFLWDTLCHTGKEIVNLEDLGYDTSNGKIVQISETENDTSGGDRIEVGVGGKTVRIQAGEEAYFYEVRY